MKLAPFPLSREPNMGWLIMRVPRELEEEWAASRGLSPWEPIPEGKVLVVIGDHLELLAGHTTPVTGEGIPAIDDGTIGIMGHDEIAAFSAWYFARLQ